ncbi:MFS transporter [Desulfuromonas soudanensis]|uniref:MFS transporter n=1 Tax=Desulfuromonas soudanensis TaxID=1603606 RepID=A0A0M4D805_9BACT|nr:pyridoxamine 5'-phosphate oxidase family protein [Desulfuromonas soudanensis]ALC17385.1 MFS transporter [Desulfuromonas soudanensis]
MPASNAEDLLVRGEYGVLSTVGADGQPYGVPLNYVYQNGCIYFHSALEGHKLDNMAENPKVSFCVVGRTRILPDRFATDYESVVAFGVASEVWEGERQSALLGLLEKYSPAYIEEGKRYIDQKEKVTRVMKIEIDHISGKARS